MDISSEMLDMAKSLRLGESDLAGCSYSAHNIVTGHLSSLSNQID